MTLPHARRMRYRSLAWVVSFCFLAVFSRLVWLHWIDAPRLRAEAAQARRVLRSQPCRRGEIRDAQDNLLAVSEDVWDIGVDPDSLVKGENARALEVATALARLGQARCSEEQSRRDHEAERGPHRSAPPALQRKPPTASPRSPSIHRRMPIRRSVVLKLRPWSMRQFWQ